MKMPFFSTRFLSSSSSAPGLSSVVRVFAHRSPLWAGTALALLLLGCTGNSFSSKEAPWWQTPSTPHTATTPDGQSMDSRGEKAEDRQAPSASASGVSAPDGELATDTEIRLSKIEAQLRTITGNLESLYYRMDHASLDMEKTFKSLDARIQSVSRDVDFIKGVRANSAEKTTSTTPTWPHKDALFPPEKAPASEPKPTSTSENKKPGILPKGSTALQYQYATKLLKQGNIPKAQTALLEFLEQHPKDSMAGGAQYWLGESYMVLGDYRNAAMSFLKTYTTYPKSEKAPASLLKLGMALTKLGEKKEACDTFTEVGARFPKADRSVLQQAATQKKKLKCSK